MDRKRGYLRNLRIWKFVGVPTVGGEIGSMNVMPRIHSSMCWLWRLPADRLVRVRGPDGAIWPCSGQHTGRDGIGGVSVLASAGFGADPEPEAAKRPNVQVGDPFEEKRLIEACLQLLDGPWSSALRT